MEGEYYLKTEEGNYIQLGIDGIDPIYRQVGVVDATKLIWLHSLIIQDWLWVRHGVMVEITF